MRSAGFLIIFVIAPVCQAVPLTIVDGRPIVPGVFLNGQGPFRFLLDTGAQTNQVDSALAARLGLVPTFRVELSTVAGGTMVGGLRLGEVALGPVRATDQEVLITRLDGVRELAMEVQGVLGQEFLRRFDYLLDLRNGRLDFGARAPATGRIPFKLVDGRMAIDTDDGPLILDSGTSTLILFREPAVRTGASRVRTSSGTTPASEVRTRHLRIAGRIYCVPAAFIGGQVAREVEGLLPVAALGAVFVSNSKGQVSIQTEDSR
jgi:hypothetical protein